jgi:hypothetical protein
MQSLGMNKMGWICIDNLCEGGHISSSGAWDGVGVAYYSIADDIMLVHDKAFDYLFAIAPSTYTLIAFLMLGAVFFAIFMSVKIGLRN